MLICKYVDANYVSQGVAEVMNISVKVAQDLVNRYYEDR